MVFVNHAQQLKWPLKRMSCAKADCCLFNPDVKRLNDTSWGHVGLLDGNNSHPIVFFSIQ